MDFNDGEKKMEKQTLIQWRKLCRVLL